MGAIYFKSTQNDLFNYNYFVVNYKIHPRKHVIFHNINFKAISRLAYFFQFEGVSKK